MGVIKLIGILLRALFANRAAHPTAEWTARQVIQAFPYEEAPRSLLRDRDGIYGAHFRECLKHFEIEEVKIAPRAPWQNPYVERLIGSIRRECLDHVIVLNEDHLRRILTEYFAYYHHARTHLALGRGTARERRGRFNALSRRLTPPLHTGGVTEPEFSPTRSEKILCAELAKTVPLCRSASRSPL